MLKLLLVEDNEINLDMIVRRLRKKFDLVVARSGTEALEKARTDAPAVILMDVGLPDIDGLEATRRLRDRPETRAIPIMLLTARVTDADRERARDAEADAQLDKPFSPAVLAERVRALLADRDG